MKLKIKSDAPHQVQLHWWQSSITAFVSQCDECGKENEIWVLRQKAWLSDCIDLNLSLFLAESRHMASRDTE